MAYLLKSSLLIALFYIVYRLFLQKDTFYKSIRIYFLTGIVISFVLPLVVIPVYVAIQTTTLNGFVLTSGTIPLQETQASIVSWKNILVVIYFIGVIYFLIKFLLELLSIRQIWLNAEKSNFQGQNFYKISDEGQAFSFWNKIFIAADSFTDDELKMILAHEKIHIKKWHSADVLLSKIMTIILWFNPFAWLYSKALQLNLEYQTDHLVQNQIQIPKEYQYLLLKTGAGKYKFALANSFNYSPLKTRIMMLQKDKSKKINQLKYLIVVPLLSLFLYSFGTKPMVLHTENTQMTKDSIKTVTGSIKHNGKDYFYVVNTFENNKILIKTYNRFGEEINNKEIEKKIIAELKLPKNKIGIEDKKVKIAKGHIKYKNKNYYYVVKRIGGKTLNFDVQIHDQYGNEVKDKDIELLAIKKAGPSFDLFFTDTIKGSKAEYLILPEHVLYYLDGKQISYKETKKIDVNTIKDIITLKGKKAIQKYGEKGKKGVIELFTK